MSPAEADRKTTEAQIRDFEEKMEFSGSYNTALGIYMAGLREVIVPHPTSDTKISLTDYTRAAPSCQRKSYAEDVLTLIGNSYVKSGKLTQKHWEKWYEENGDAFLLWWKSNYSVCPQPIECRCILCCGEFDFSRSRQTRGRTGRV